MWKASAYLKKEGFKKIYQLDGGILNYLNYHKNKSKANNWQGECFVFDKRVTVNKKLNAGKYIQCYGCRRPITKNDLKSKYYQHGVHCHNCYLERSEDQKKRSKERQKQINIKLDYIKNKQRVINKGHFWILKICEIPNNINIANVKINELIIIIIYGFNIWEKKLFSNDLKVEICWIGVKLYELESITRLI